MNLSLTFTKNSSYTYFVQAKFQQKHSDREYLNVHYTAFIERKQIYANLRINSAFTIPVVSFYPQVQKIVGLIPSFFKLKTLKLEIVVIMVILMWIDY